MANQRRKILVFKVENDDVVINIDAASSSREREVLTSTIYRVLSYYSLDFVVRKKNVSNYFIAGLARLDYHQNIIQDIEDEYLEWHLNRPGVI